jgi:hypothetical protein
MSFLNSSDRRDSWLPISFDVYWPLVISVLALGLAGVMLLYSVAGGDFSPWAWRHAMRLAIGLVVMLMIASFDVRTIIMFMQRFCFCLSGLSCLGCNPWAPKDGWI